MTFLRHKAFIYVFPISQGQLIGNVKVHKYLPQYGNAKI